MSVLTWIDSRYTDRSGVYTKIRVKQWLFIVSVATALAQSQPNERTAHWREDLQFLSAGLTAPGIRIAGGIASRGQKDFALLYPNFDKEIAAIDESIPSLTDSEITLRLMRLIASAHVAHNIVEPPAGMGFLNRLPVNFSWFDDGLAVSAATTEYTETLGARVLKIGGLTPEEFLKELEPYISYENETELRTDVRGLMNARGVLDHFHLIDPARHVMLLLETPDGRALSVSLPLVTANAKRIRLEEGLHIPEALYRSRPGVTYWHQYLRDSQTLFISYNRCANDPKKSFVEFVKEVFAEADALAVKRVVIDLRWNGGGNSRVIGPLISGLEARRKALGPIYALIGPYTFSSSVDNAIQLRRDLSARLVGEPSGGMPRGYGEVAKLTLPNSKIVIRYTTKNWGAKDGDKTLVPDIAAPFTLKDVLAGRDPGLEAVLR